MLLDTHHNKYVKHISHTTSRLKHLDMPSIALSSLRLAFIVEYGIQSSFCQPTWRRALSLQTELDKECSFCHLDPAGGGPRNRIGEIFEENYFEFPEDFDMEAVTEEVKEVVKQLTTSLDFQTAFIKTTHVDAEQNCYRQL